MLKSHYEKFILLISAFINIVASAGEASSDKVSHLPLLLEMTTDSVRPDVTHRSTLAFSNDIFYAVELRNRESSGISVVNSLNLSFSL